MHVYRQLAEHESDDLKTLLSVFGEAFDDRERYQRALPADTYLRRLLASETFIAMVAEADGTIVGGLAAYVLPKFESERSEIYIYDLAVAESHRRRGIATRLIRELQRIAEDRHASVIFVQADHEDDAAIALYESFGPRQNVLHFDIPVRE